MFGFKQKLIDKQKLIEVQQKKIEALENLISAQNELVATQKLVIEEKNKFINILKIKNALNTQKAD